MRDILIDLETMGQRPGCAIFELAAVQFDMATGATGAEFVALIEPWNGHFEEDTVAWHKENGTWPQPGKAARISARQAFADFASWYASLGEVRGVWAWGASFDFPVLQAIWRDYGPTPDLPWRYHQGQCARTVCKLAYGEDWRHGDRPHEALEDCKAAIADLVMAANRDIDAVIHGNKLSRALWAALPVVEDARADAVREAAAAHEDGDADAAERWGSVAKSFRMQAERIRELVPTAPDGKEGA